MATWRWAPVAAALLGAIGAWLLVGRARSAMPGGTSDGPASPRPGRAGDRAAATAPRRASGVVLPFSAGRAAGGIATTSRSASRPAYPPPGLRRQAQDSASKLRRRLDKSFRIVVAAPFVVAGNMAEADLRRYVRGSIVRPAEAMWASYFRVTCDQVITILLLADEGSYRAWSARLFGDTDVPYFGYYRHADRTLVMNIHTGTGTLVHELTHALIDFDWPGVPLWFNEGLASLHEQCRVSGDRIIGLPNWRLGGLQEEIRRGRLRSLADLTAEDDFYGTGRGVNYAHARYFCMYLQHRGLLRRFYKDYRAAHAKGVAAGNIIEAVCGEGIAQVDGRLHQWAMTLEWD